ncbi:MAG: NAD(P)-dependent oxidoreductase [Candidatus Bathyarchaeia archaeon]
MNVLITGGTGFIGSHITRELANSGETVIAYDLYPNTERIRDVTKNVKIVLGDVSDYATLMTTIKKEKVSHIIHLAYVTDISGSQQRPLYAVNSNCTGYLNIIEAARVMDVERVVCASSRDVYGPSDYYPRQPVTEDDPVKPTNVYGSCKAFNEFLAEQYHKIYGIDIVNLRPTIVYGPGRHFRGVAYYTVDLFLNPVKGEPVYLNCGDLRINIVYVKDVARAFVLALKAQKIRHLVYNVGGEETLVRDIASCVKKLIPSASIQIEDGCGPFVQFPRIDSSRAREDFGYDLLYPLERGVKEYIEYFRESLSRN